MAQKIFVDSSLIDADASNNSVVDTHSLKRHLNKSYKELEKRLEDQGSMHWRGNGSKGDVNKRYISTTRTWCGNSTTGSRQGKAQLQNSQGSRFGA